ncbi:SPFH domain / band 7 family protein [Cellulophaga phage phi17:2_18]|uniref:SPFH domain / Band 7 family n=2 Tax=Lightbulbvirus Cba172 TaxID=1918525 RepID=R9ZZK3_9CAUD|nr:SPFH domain / Band 7 family [Cellulophaga phage phi17:2]AGO47702.1 SPFH domain / Band 7 family [Cellulophaga phage phi17:2]ALO80572.1 SPFH domain / band 7 family protein [Cellulophaga phage phi17:2_18]
MKKFIGLLLIVSVFMSCNRPEPNYEGVLMTDYGRNGIESFKVVTGAQGPLGPGSELYEVPMWEQKGDPRVVEISAKDAGVFTVDPAYTYIPIRGKGPEIVLAYKNYNVNNPNSFFESVEENVINKRVTDAYREEARGYTTDSLMNNLTGYENAVQNRLKKEFNSKYFELTTLTSGLKPPKSMADAIERRNRSIQEANEVENQLRTAEMLLQKATIDAETNRVSSLGLTKEILTARYIEALRNSKNRIIITDGKTPVILN